MAGVATLNGIMGAALGVLLLVGIASAAVLSVQVSDRRPPPTTRRAARVSRAYVIHDPMRNDRSANALALLQLAATAADKAHMWPATMTARDPNSHAAYEACPMPRVLVGEYGATASHVAALEHALASDAELLHPASNRWVLVFEDDALPRLDGARVIARIKSALNAAAQRNIDAVFFGWLFPANPSHNPSHLVRVGDTLWRSRAPFMAIAYALRGSALPGILTLLKTLHCTMPVDCVYRKYLRDALIVTHSQDAVPQPGVLREALFDQLETPSSIAEANKPRTTTRGAIA